MSGCSIQGVPFWKLTAKRETSTRKSAVSKEMDREVVTKIANKTAQKKLEKLEGSSRRKILREDIVWGIAVLYIPSWSKDDMKCSKPTLGKRIRCRNKKVAVYMLDYTARSQ